MPKWFYVVTMSTIEKLIGQLLSRPTDMRFNQVETLLRHLGYELFEGRGSRVKFKNEEMNSIISFHKPHGSNSLKLYQIDQIIEKLTEARLLP